MSNTIVEIEGNAVTVIEKVVKNSGTLTEFLSKLQERPSLIENIPANCIAIGTSTNQTTYHIAVDAHISQLRLKQQDYGDTGEKKNIFLPYSVFSVVVRDNSNGTSQVIQSYWHLCTERPMGGISALKVYQNFLPNTRDKDNQICFGTIERDFKTSTNSDVVVQNLIADVRGSIYTAHWMEGRKFTASLEGAVSEYYNKTSKKTAKKRLDKINELLKAIEACDWESMTDAQADAKADERVKLTTEREKKIKDVRAKVDNWRAYYFDFLEWWTEEHKELIEADSVKASKALLIDTMNYKAGTLMVSGQRSN